VGGPPDTEVRDRGEPALPVGDDHAWIARVDTRRLTAPAPNEQLTRARLEDRRRDVALSNGARRLGDAQQEHGFPILSRHPGIERSDYAQVRPRGPDHGWRNDRVVRMSLRDAAHPRSRARRQTKS